MNSRIYALLLLFVFFTAGLTAQTTVNITDASLVAGQTYNWTKNNTYVVDGLTFLEEGGVLNIEAGTVIKFTERGDVGNPSALIITRGSKIFARGTKDAPIIMTSVRDSLNANLGPNDNALWGGLVILGKGITQRTGNATPNVEGIPTTETRAIYGGTDNNDDSGVVRYVSIRHGGRILSGSNEINGLTLGAVGSKTVLEYIEIYANSDDGIEFFGGAPNLKYAVVAFAEDDSFDWDEVYLGKGQFWFSIQRPTVGDHGAEFDGTTPDDQTPASKGTVYNWTHIGNGQTATAGGLALLLRAGTAGTIANSIFMQTRGKAIEVQDNTGAANDALKKLQAGELKILNNIFFQISANRTTLDTAGIIRVTSGQTLDEPAATTLASHLTTNLNTILANPSIRSISRAKDAGLDPRPTFTGAAYTTPLATLPASDSFFVQTDFKGAFGSSASQSWIAGWTTLAKNGHLANLNTPSNIVNITDTSLVAGQTYNWTSDKTYVVDGLTFLEEGGVLNIEAGTVIKFTERGDVGNPSALIITRGSKIFARGTKDAPIIMTSVRDSLNANLGPNDNALWGGLVILGKGITQRSGNATPNVEGIPTTETRAIYGGTDNNDDSGVVRYVSIRHGGRILSGSNEINGLTLGAVGSKTVLEYIEIYANSDDGIEFFGGAPNLKYAVVAFVEDDCYDWDEVYVGKGQFWFSIQRPTVGDHGAEFDGTTPDDQTPASKGTVYNWTHIGTGQTATAGGLALLLRAGTAGTIANSIFMQTRGKAIEVQDNTGAANDALKKLQAGELKILNNIFFQISTNRTTLDTAGIIRVTSGQTLDEPAATTLASHLTTNLNTILADPGVRSISRAKDKKLDPRPTLTGSAYITPRAALPASDAFFTSVNYKGAFSADGSQLWIMDWTTLAKNGHLVDVTTATQEVLEKEIANNFKIYPNPTRAGSFFTIESDFTEKVRIDIFSINGSLVRTIPANLIGTTAVDIQSLEKGMYIVKFTTEKGKFAAKKLIVE